MSATSKLQPLQLLPISSDTNDFVVYLERALRLMATSRELDLGFVFKPLESSFQEEAFRLTYDPTNPLSWAWFNMAFPYQRTISKTDFAPFWSKDEEAQLQELGYSSFPTRRWRTAPLAVQAVMESGVGGLLRIFASAHRAPGAVGFLPGYAYSRRPRPHPTPEYAYSKRPHPHYTLSLPATPSNWLPCQSISELGVGHLRLPEGEESRFSCSGVYVPAEEEASRDLQERWLDILIAPATSVEEQTL